MKLTQEIILEVAAWVALHTGLAVEPPTVVQLSPAGMIETVPGCRKAHERVRHTGRLLHGLCSAWDGVEWETGRLYIGSWLSEPETRSWLAHLIAHAARRAARFPNPESSCEAKRDEEAFAYAVQNAYNDAHGIRWRYEPPRIRCPTGSAAGSAPAPTEAAQPAVDRSPTGAQ